MLAILKPFVLSTARHALTAGGAAAIAYASHTQIGSTAIAGTGLSHDQIATAIVGGGMVFVSQIWSWAEKARR